MRNNKKAVGRIIWFALVFCTLFIWFTQVHPLVVYDSDDWVFLSYIRRGFPVWGDWNPSRVLPETLMPLVCSVSAHLLYPWTGNYIGSIMWGSALVVSLCITVYVICFTKMVERVFSLTSGESVTVSVFFFLLHFLVFRSEGCANQYMFYCWDLTCYYFYLIPSLLNASLVMIMIKNKDFDVFMQEKENGIQKGLFLLAVYLAVFSNLPCSGILAAFSGCKVLFALLELAKKERKTETSKESTLLHAGILILWFISAIFELSGGRAESVSGSGITLFQSIQNIVSFLIHPTVYTSKAFLLMAFMTIVLAVTFSMIYPKKDPASGVFCRLFTELLVCGAALLVYMLLLMAKVDWASVYRAEYLFGLFFYLILITMASLCFLLKKSRNTMLAVPILLYVMLSCINTTGQTFRDSNMRNMPADTWMRIGNDMVSQFVEADLRGDAHIYLYVPVSDKDMNWPLFEGYNGFAIGDTLYEHGVTSRRIEFTVVPDMEMNEKYNLPVSH